MTGRAIADDLAAPDAIPAAAADLVLRAPPNWTAVIFFACLGLLHLIIATLAFLHGRWEGMMSMLLGSIFTTVAIVSSRCCFELVIQPRQRRMRLRSGLRRLF